MRVYIAGPYSKGNQEENVDRAIDTAEELIRAFHIPFVPHLYHYWHRRYPHEYSLWTGQGIEWLQVCQALIRLPGESPGADVEIQVAHKNNIPVFDSVDIFLRWYSCLLVPEGLYIDGIIRDSAGRAVTEFPWE
jgi:hypothetical protein